MPDEQQPFYVATVRHRKRTKQPKALRQPQQVYHLMRPLVREAEQEHFYCIHLNARHLVTQINLVSVGSLSASIVHPREVFRDAIRNTAAAVIVCHNHPSGDPEPSQDDCEITKRLVGAGQLIGIEVLDHIIVADGQFTSFRERGLIP